MKNVMTKLMIAAAAFVAVAGVASAQSMEAKIPFGFRAAGKALPAGTYRVHVSNTGGSGRMILISSANGVGEVLTVAHPGSDAKRSWQAAGNAVLSFQCGLSRCVLTDIWAADSSPVYRFPTPGLGRDEPLRTAEIVMHPVKAD